MHTCTHIQAQNSHMNTHLHQKSRVACRLLWHQQGKISHHRPFPTGSSCRLPVVRCGCWHLPPVEGLLEYKLQINERQNCESIPIKKKSTTSDKIDLTWSELLASDSDVSLMEVAGGGKPTPAVLWTSCQSEFVARAAGIVEPNLSSISIAYRASCQDRGSFKHKHDRN